MKALITGAGGLLGSDLSRLLPTSEALDHGRLDVTDEQAVWRSLSRRRVDVVFHCAAISDVDHCERDPVLARRVNALGARNVAKVCAALGIYLMALSTDYVFDGKPGKDLLEDDTPKPISVYGKTKYEGETAVQECAPGAAIVRTSWIYGGARPTFVDGILRRGRAGERLEIVSNQESSPTWSWDLAQGLIRLTRHHPRGILHLTNEGHVARDDWARAILESANLDSGLVQTVSYYPALARRPRYSALANTRARRLGVRLEPWRDALDAFLRSQVDGRPVTLEQTETVA